MFEKKSIFAFRISTKLLETVFSKVLEPIRRVNLIKSEFILLLVLLFCNFCGGNLSEHARTVLQEESMKYSKILLRHLQLTHGQENGAKRYLEIISLIGTYFQFAEKHRHLYLLRRFERSDSNGKLPPPPLLLDEIML